MEAQRFEVSEKTARYLTMLKELAAYQEKAMSFAESEESEDIESSDFLDSLADAVQSMRELVNEQITENVLRQKNVI